MLNACFVCGGTGRLLQFRRRQVAKLCDKHFSKIKDHYNVGYEGLYNVYPTSDVTADGKV